MKLTGWYEGTQKPKRIGVYQRWINPGSYRILTSFNEFGTLIYGEKEYEKKEMLFSVWDGKKWRIGKTTVRRSYKHYCWPSAYQYLPWRGVAK